MDPERLSKLLHVGVVLSMALGIAGITRGSPAVAGVGVVLVIAGLIGLMPALRFQLGAGQAARDEWKVD